VVDGKNARDFFRWHGELDELLEQRFG
jgi:hypothetical protein